MYFPDFYRAIARLDGVVDDKIENSIQCDEGMQPSMFQACTKWNLFK